MPVTHFQMLSFLVLCKNWSSFPVVNTFVRDKRFASYVKVLDEIKRHTTGLHLGSAFGREALTVTTDFESALIKALKRVGGQFTDVTSTSAEHCGGLSIRMVCR